jgi:N-acetylneuraminic acid mutarotase
MKKQDNRWTKVQIVRSAFTSLLLVALCASQLALAQRQESGRQNIQQGAHDEKGVQERPSMSPETPFVPELSSWTVVANYPLAIENTAVASDGTYAYSAGGLTLGGFTNGFYRYEPHANIWTTLASVPTGFYFAPAVYAANTNSIYVFGGTIGFFTAFDNTQIYNISTGTWSAGAPMPAGRYAASAAYYGANGKIYVIGGFDSNSNETDQTWEYDPVADSWDTSRADIPVGMAGAGYSIVGEFIYLAGGWGGGSGSTNHYRYDIVNNTWASMAPVPVAIYAPASAAIGMQTYLVGGGHVLLGASNNEFTVALHSSLRMPSVSYDSTYIYDTLSNTWTTGPNTNSAHWFSGGTAIDRQLLVVAGESASGDTDIVEMATAPRAQPTPRPHPTPAPRP